MPKRRKTEDLDDGETSTPRKLRRTSQKNDQNEIPSAVVADRPSKRKSILKGTPTKVNGVLEPEPTPKSLRKVLFSTPSKPVEEGEIETPTAVRNDRSARKKSAKALQEQTVDDASDDDEEHAQDAGIAKEILDDEDSEAEQEEEAEAPTSSARTTASKRGRPKGRRRERTPSPPPNLPPHELYFFQNRAGGNKTSANTLPSHLLLNHENYYAQINAYKDTHEAGIKRLRQLHRRAFDQWIFELDEGFNLCLYGYGSKRELVMEFADHMYAQGEKKAPRIVVVNGYTPGLTIRDMLTTLASVILPRTTKFPAQPTALLDLLLTTLTESKPSTPIRLVIHSLDHSNLRKPTTQSPPRPPRLPPLNLPASNSGHPQLRAPLGHLPPPPIPLALPRHHNIRPVQPRARRRGRSQHPPRSQRKEIRW